MSAIDFLDMPHGPEREKQIRDLHRRLHKRRNYDKIPNNFTRLKLPRGIRQLQVLAIVDSSTSGKFAISSNSRTVAFEYESDATMFSLSSI